MLHPAFLRLNLSHHLESWPNKARGGVPTSSGQPYPSWDLETLDSGHGNQKYGFGFRGKESLIARSPLARTRKVKLISFSPIWGLEQVYGKQYWWRKFWFGAINIGSSWPTNPLLLGEHWQSNLSYALVLVLCGKKKKSSVTESLPPLRMPRIYDWWLAFLVSVSNRTVTGGWASLYLLVTVQLLVLESLPGVP